MTEMFLAGVSTRRVGEVMEVLTGRAVSAQTVWTCSPKTCPYEMLGSREGKKVWDEEAVYGEADHWDFAPVHKSQPTITEPYWGYRIFEL